MINISSPNQNLYQKKMKAQTSMIEHLFVIFFIIVALVAIMFFLTNFQFSQMEMERRKVEGDRSLSMMKRFLNSQFIAKKENMLEDAKLFAMLGFTCGELEKMFGSNWFVSVQLLDESDVIVPCPAADWQCNQWSFSSCSQPAKNVSYILPVNIYRKMFERSDIGVIKVGVYI